MKVALFDFQKDALDELRARLVAAQRIASSESPQAISFSAPTGSGKTVIMTALFEAILDTPDDQLDWPLDWQPQHDAVILWVSDMPELNVQTRRKIESQSDKVYRAKQLIVIDSSFDQERLEGGNIYFINTQKLATDKLLTRVGDRRQFSVWTTLTNTARAIPDRFYVVIDEAHRGMSNGRVATQARSIVQRFVLGHPESGLDRMPILVGVSATPKRFNDLLSDTPHTVHKVLVRPEDVRASGLLKERILIHHPENSTKAEMGLLEEASRRWTNMTKLWDSYCREETERYVKPILVVQVENGTENRLTKTDLSAALQAIEIAIGRSLSDSEIAHALQEAGDIEIDDRKIRKIEASRIEEDGAVSVVFFKTSLSTGWDCPRAEVMMSFRRAEDHTYIAQLLGRMVRTPLARRVERKAELNDVHLFLPHFDRVAVTSVIVALQSGDDVPPTEVGVGSELVVLNRRQGTERIFEAMADLVTYRVNAYRAQSHIRRYLAISRQLTIDGIDEAAWPAAKEKMLLWIDQQVSGLKEEGKFDKERKALTQVGINTVAVEGATGMAEEREDYIVEVSDLDLERQFDEAGRALSNGLHIQYWKAHADDDATEVKLEFIVLSRNKSAVEELEHRALSGFNELFDRFRPEFSKLPEQQRIVYEKLRSASATPVELQWQLQESIDFKRSPEDPFWERHLYVEKDGSFRTELGSWEAGVLQEELKDDEVVAWLRNLDRKPWSLEIPYQNAGKPRPMFPDLLIVRNKGGRFLFDILEPHDPSLADNFEKAKGLAKFAERHGDLFGRIQLIRKRQAAGGRSHFARLEINRSNMIDRIRDITTNSQLDAIFDALA